MKITLINKTRIESTEQSTLELPADMTLTSLKEWAVLDAGVLFIVNGRAANDDLVISPGDVVVAYPPIDGG